MKKVVTLLQLSPVNDAVEIQVHLGPWTRIAHFQVKTRLDSAQRLEFDSEAIQSIPFGQVH